MIVLRKRAGAVITVSVVLLATAACRSQSETVTSSQTQSSDTIVSSTPPFQTKEPERYQAVRTITTVNADGQTVVTKTSVARDGEMRRQESGKIVYLDDNEVAATSGRQASAGTWSRTWDLWCAKARAQIAAEQTARRRRSR